MAGNATDARRSVISKLSVILLAFSKGGAYTLSELAEHTGLPVSTTHRLATELADWQVLERCEDRRFRPGLALRTMGAVACCSTSLRDRAAPVLDDLSVATGATTRLGLLSHRAISYIYKEPNQPVSQFSPAATLPLHATALGKVLLAFAAPCLVEDVLARKLAAYTPMTITDPEQLRWTLKLTRAHRIAVADRELQPTYAGVAAPVFGVGGRVVAAIEVRMENISGNPGAERAALVVAAGSLSRELERPCCECSARGSRNGLTEGLTANRFVGSRPVALVIPPAGEPETGPGRHLGLAVHHAVRDIPAESW